MEKLKKCPFCGGEAIIHQAFGLELWEITCIQCNAKIHYQTSKQKAMRAWNTRTKKSTSATTEADKPSHLE